MVYSINQLNQQVLETVLTLQNLSKHYGKIKAVNDLTIDVYRGNVFGILGPNGSGKTTTLGMIMDVINPTSGQFSWFNGRSSTATRKRIGAILEHPIFYPYLTGKQNLKIVCDIKGVAYNRVEQVLEQVGLSARGDSKFKTFSLGMKQRLSIASALLCDPEVLILDEPTNGLDPQGIAEIRELIIDIANGGKTIIMASHLLDEVQKVCTHFCVLQSGKLIHNGLVEDVGKGERVVEVKADHNGLEQLLKQSDMALNIKRELDKYLVTMKPGKGAVDLNTYLFEHNVVVKHLVVKVKTLEKQFLEILASQEK